MTFPQSTAAAALMLASIAAPAALADPAGLMRLELDMPHHGRATSAALWYPAAPGGAQTLFADNPVFSGVTAMQDAPVAPGTHPVVLLSHGMGGGIQSTAWLAAGLAERGAIVLSLNHINSTWSAFDMSKGVEHWSRAQDLSRALDVISADERIAGHLDDSRTMAAGFSFGGWTALSMGGALANHAGILEVCRNTELELVYCDQFLSDKINLAEIDPEAWNASYRDPRVTHVTAIDPGFVWGIAAEDLSQMVPQVTLIGLGEGQDRLSAADFDASGFAAHLPDAHVDRIVPGTHFTAMPLCKPAGPAILEEERDDPVCTDPQGADRAEVHARIINSLAADLGL